MVKFRMALLIAAGLSLASCNQYWERKDTIAFGAGDSVAANTALMVPNPWPPGSRDTHIISDGARAQLAIERYRKGAVTPLATGISTGGGTAPTAPTQ